MSKLQSSLQSLVTILALAAAWLIAMRFIWPRLVAFTIFSTSWIKGGEAWPM